MRRWLAALPSLLLFAGCFDPSDLDETGATGTTGGTLTDGEPTGESGVPAGPSCEDYCQLIEDHCTDENEQYSGNTVCEAVCGVLPLGTEEDELGNTVGCRVHHTLLAAEQTDPHCRHSGPSGDATCGASCENFCTIALAVCTGADAVWDGAEACIADCTMFATDPPYTSSTPDADTFACRMHHLTLASLQPDVHCAHIALVSDVCQ